MENSENKKEKYAGRSRQTSIYFKKFLRIFIAENQWMMLVMSALIAFIVSSVVRTMFVNMEWTLLGGLAVSCICLWNGVFNSIQVVCKERAIVKREHRGGLSIFAYFAAHMWTQAIICVLQSIITIVVMYFCKIHFPQKGLVSGIFVVDFFITLFLITYAADMLGLMVSCVVKNTTLAMTVMPFILIVQLVFAGVAFPLYGKAARLSNFTITKWGVSAVCIEGNYNSLPSNTMYNQLYNMVSKDKELLTLFKEIPKETITMYSAQQVQKSAYAYDVSGILRTWLYLAIFALVFAVVGVIVLEFIDFDKR